MNKNKISRIWWLGTVMILMVSMLSLPASAKDLSEEPITMETSQAEMPAPVMATAEDLAEPPALTEEQLANLQWAADNTPGALPVIEGQQAEPVGPEAGTESMLSDVRLKPGEPLAPGSAMTYSWTNFGGSIPAGFKSNVMESSVDGKARKQWFTGNWFAARSLNKGLNWTYFSAFTGMSDFCCDQVIIHDMARDIYLWLRMGVPDGAGENRFTLSVDFQDPFVGGYWVYAAKPESVNGTWQNVWWDYPAMAMTADYLFISWNQFTAAGAYARTVVLKWPLDALATGSGFSYSYISTTGWATFKPIKGADHTMYLASTWPNSIPQNSRIGIFRWRDSDNNLVFWDKTITAWTFTSRGSAHCGSPNWAARYDQRTLAGARYNIDTSDVANPGRNIVAWWWNVKEGGGFAYPYIEAAAFYEDTMTQVSGTDGRPLVYNSVQCFAYPDVASNIRSDLGMVFNFASSPYYQRPRVGFALADDYASSPPGWFFYGAAASTAGPSDAVWGDYNTTYASHGPAIGWSAGVHAITGPTSNCSNCSSPIMFFYGRERDMKSWQMW